MRNLPTPQAPATPTRSTAAISGKLLAAATSPAEALSELRRYFNELAKHQEFIAMAWNQRYKVGLEIRDPMNARMHSAIGQVNAMICMVENQLKALERAKPAVQCAELPVERNSLPGEVVEVSHV
jgi:protoheme ferro-lyase